MGKAKFVHWMESPFEDIPSEPMFNVLKNERGLPNGSTVSIEQLEKTYQIETPLYPSLENWKKEVAEKRRCFNCYASLRGKADLERHKIYQHRGI